MPTFKVERLDPELLHPDILTDIGTFLMGNSRSNRSTLNVGILPLVPRRFQRYLGWFWCRKTSLIRGGIKGKLFCLLVLTHRVGHCIAAAVDMDLASGASNIYSLIAGSFIIWQGTCRYHIKSLFFGLEIPSSFFS